jgi:hypothetical protein
MNDAILTSLCLDLKTVIFTLNLMQVEKRAFSAHPLQRPAQLQTAAN